MEKINKLNQGLAGLLVAASSLSASANGTNQPNTDDAEPQRVSLAACYAQNKDDLVNGRASCNKTYAAKVDELTRLFEMEQNIKAEHARILTRNYESGICLGFREAATRNGQFKADLEDGVQARKALKDPVDPDKVRTMLEIHKEIGDFYTGAIKTCDSKLGPKP